MLFFGVGVLFLISAATNENPFLAAVSVAMATVLLCSPVAIPLLHRLKFGQSIRNEGPKSHQIKSGTPTMGGIVIVAGLTLGALFGAELTPPVLLALFVTLGHCALGFADDYIKVVKKRNLGLKAWQKFLGQVVIALVTVIIGRQVMNIDTEVWLPIVNDKLDIGILYYPFVIFVLVGASNAVNLTDGLDGLAAGTVAVAMSVYAGVALLFDLPDLAIFAAATAAACVGFLAFNAHPAKVFMGDTGSLALGGAFAAMGILTQTELLLAVVGIVFVAEAMSVIIQVISFKTTGQRVFRMSPLHHHFELGGWSEWKVVCVFWGAGIIAALIGLMLIMPYGGRFLS